MKNSGVLSPRRPMLVPCSNRGVCVSGAHSRRKGAGWERELAGLFRVAMPGATVRRGLQYRSGAEVPDVECPVFWIEAKRHKKTNIHEALRQAMAAAPDGRMPLAVCKNDGEPATATLLLDDLLELVREWWERRQ